MKTWVMPNVSYYCETTWGNFSNGKIISTILFSPPIGQSETSGTLSRVKNVAGAAWFHGGTMLHLEMFLPFQDRKLSHSFVVWSRLDFCSFILSACPYPSFKASQLIQNAATCQLKLDLSFWKDFTWGIFSSSMQLLSHLMIMQTAGTNSF